MNELSVQQKHESALRFLATLSAPRLAGTASAAASPTPPWPTRQRPPAQQVCLAAPQTTAPRLGCRHTAARTHTSPLAPPACYSPAHCVGQLSGPVWRTRAPPATTVDPAAAPPWFAT